MLLVLGLLLFGGVFAGQLCGRLGLPRIAGYVVTGVFFSEGILGGPLGLETTPWSEPVAVGALGIVAYLIGGAITPGQIRRVGAIVFSGALAATVIPALLVFFGVWGMGLEVGGVSSAQLGLALGAIASTTAPAATVAVIHQYRAKGPMTSALLGIVAVDDAIGLIIYAFVMAMGFGGSLVGTIESAAWEIVGAVCLGAASGYVLVGVTHWVRLNGLRLSLILGSILLVTAVAQRAAVSPLLAAMSMGFVCRAIHGASGERLFAPIELLEELVLVAFFTIAGTHFRAEAFVSHLAIVLAYIVLRGVGKITGAGLGASIVRAPIQLRRWLGFGLVPQAGVAVGLVLSLSHHPAFSQAGAAVVNIVLAATMVHELVGPLMARLALSRAGELGPRRRSQRRGHGT